MNTIQSIKDKLTGVFHPSHIDLLNEGSKHRSSTDISHLKLVLVSDAFESKNLLARQRLINEVLQEELKGEIHALIMVLKTPAEWSSEKGALPESPPCMGGAKN
ncbi:MAG: hypothetical protein ACD_73C00114G0002 [uncultured bacterium]|nr:MAG: hypothetical protein ACD_73C00114G0002 [uncultured bacterium]